MSDTESEHDLLTHSITNQNAVPPRLEASQLVSHLVGHVDESSTESYNVESAIQFLSQVSPNELAKADDANNEALANAARAIIVFLKVLKTVISSQERYSSMSLIMQRRLVKCLDTILSENFIGALFLLRQHVHDLAIQQEHVVSPHMATLPDAVLAAIIDYTSWNGVPERLSGGWRAADRSQSRESIQLAVRLPRRMDSLSSFLAAPITGVKRTSEILIKSAALCLLYCCNLNPLPDKKLQRPFIEELLSFLRTIHLAELSSTAIAHVLCLYMMSYERSIDELHAFRPATDSALWALLFELFPDPRVFFKNEMNQAQQIVTVHGACMMPWIWCHGDLCPNQEVHWIETFTILWIARSCSSNHIEPLDVERFGPSTNTDCSYGNPGNPSEPGATLTKGPRRVDLSWSGSRREACAKVETGVLETLLANDGVGLKFLTANCMRVLETLPDQICQKMRRYITNILIQMYLELCNSKGFLIAEAVRGELVTLLENSIHCEIQQSLAISGRVEMIDSVILMPSKARDQILKSCHLALQRLLDSTLLAIQMSADPKLGKKSVHEVQALSSLSFLLKWIRVHQFDERLIKPISFVANLLKTLHIPLRCSHAITLAVVSLVLSIEEAAEKRWKLNQEQLQIIAKALVQVSDPDHEKSGLVTAEFVTIQSVRFDYGSNYPLILFDALREQLSNIIWIPNTTFIEHKGSSRLTHISRNVPAQEVNSRISLSHLIADAMHLLFINFDEATKKYIKASPMSRDLWSDLKSHALNNVSLGRLCQILQAL